nr:zinc finger, CCHC-type [Tanacetum cinerariifolium]
MSGPNFIDWYRQLMIVLSIEDKLNYLEQPIHPASVVPMGVIVVKKVAKSDLDSVLSIRLRFCGKESDFEQDWSFYSSLHFGPSARRCVLSWTAFCPGLRFVMHCVLLKPNGEALRKCILSGPYKPTTVLVQAVEAIDDSPAVPEHTTVEIPMNMSPENKAHFLAEKEAVHLILTGIGDEIYSTVDACQIAQEMWEAIERLQQCEALNIQDVKTNLFWEFRKFTSHDGETMESYYTRFYKLMSEMIQNNLTVTTMQVNV